MKNALATFIIDFIEIPILVTAVVTVQKVDKHNQVIDRVYKLEQKDAVHDEEIKVANHRIADLEAHHKPNSNSKRTVN